MKRAGLALGSNLGDRVHLIKTARDLCEVLNGEGECFLQSGLYQTEPVDCPDGSGQYLNAVVELAWGGTANELLERCQLIEQRLGRVRMGIKNGPRMIDVDLLYLGSERVDLPQLMLPHPRLHQRKFVLKPLSDIRPELVLPAQTETVSALLDALPASEPDPVLFAVEW